MRSLYAIKGVCWEIDGCQFHDGLLTISVESKSIYDSAMLFIWIEQTVKEIPTKKYFEIDLRQIKFFRIITDRLIDGYNGSVSIITIENEIYLFKFNEGINQFIDILHKWPLCHIVPSTSQDLDQSINIFRVTRPFLQSSLCSIHEGSFSLVTKSEFENYVGKNGRIHKYNILKRHIYHSGISNEMIQHLWPLLLHVYPENVNPAEKYAWLSQRKLEYTRLSILDLRYEMGEDCWFNLDKAIKQDVSRTDNLVSLFDNNDERKSIIRNILLKFVSFDRKTGYHQGMSDIVSLLYYSIGIEDITFWCFVGFIKITPYGKKKRIHSSIDDCVNKLKELTKIFLPSFYSLLSKMDMGLEFIFTHRWFFVNCRREFSLQDSQSILTATISSHYETDFIVYICLAICACYQDELISNCRTIDDVMQFFLRLSNSIPLKLILRQARCFGYLHNKLSNKKLKTLFQ